MLSQNQISFGNKRLQEVAISLDVPILKAARILAGKEIKMFWKWVNADEFLNYKLNETQNFFEKEKKQYAEDSKTYEKPWELWQVALAHEGSLNWIDLYREPNWNEYCIYRRKQTTFVPEYYSGLNWRDAEHLIGKPIEYANYPNEVWEYGILQRIVLSGKNFYVGRASFYTYIRTCEKTFKHPTINIGGIKLPKPETVAPELGAKYWLSPTCTEMYWRASPYDISELNSCRVHLTEDRAKAWSDWWEKEVIDKIKGE